MTTSIDASATTAAQNGTSPDAIAPATATDAPWVTYPPFPKPPPGVIVIPFKTFKPKGIYVVEAESDAPPDDKRVERDAMGIPTVMLASQHSLTEAERKKRSTKKLKRVETNGDGTVRRLLWFEEWEAGERDRRTIIDPSTLRVDRLHQASHDFKNGRPWPNLPSNVPQLWDAFRLYIGLISSIQPPPGAKLMKQARALADAERGESDDDSDDAMDGNPKPDKEVVIGDEEQAHAIRLEKIRTAPPKRGVFTEDERQLRREDFHEAKNSRTDVFFDETERCVKVFFSSYFREKGLIWSEQRVRDGPILVGFWLNFLLRNRVLPEPEYEKGLRKALLVVEQARKELPQTFVIGKALPDCVGVGCEALWGSKGQTWASLPSHDDAKKTADTPEEPDAKRRKIDDETATLLKDVIGDDAKVEVLTPETVAAIEKDVHKAETTADASGDGASGSGWAAAGWGNVNAPDSSAAADEGWGDPDPDTWAGDDGSTWDIEPQPNPLMAHLGATALPLTHTTGVVERSTRKIVSIMPPLGLATTKAEKKRLKGLSKVGLVEDDLNARFAKMTLASWPVWGTQSDILPPVIMGSSRGPVVKDETATMDESANPKPHNPFKDTITVLLDPAVADKMLVGMSLGGAWVQIVRQNQSGEDDAGEPGEPTSFWYVEQLMSTLPSYHTEAYM